MKYLKDNDLLPDLQSTYRAMHSTETAVLKVLADILLALDSGDLAMLTLLDLSATFDTVSGSVRSTTGIGPQANPIPSVHADLLQLVKQ